MKWQVKAFHYVDAHDEQEARDKVLEILGIGIAVGSALPLLDGFNRAFVIEVENIGEAYYAMQQQLHNPQGTTTDRNQSIDHLIQLLTELKHWEFIGRWA
jgi:hypothetical protein